MIVLELDEVEIDHCTSCQGIWLDAGELELMLGDSGEKEAFLSSFQVEGYSKERGRKCPLCSRRMEKVLVGADRKVRVDRCRGREGIWLDGGELEKILEMASFGPDRRVLHLLQRLFAKRHDR
jgi:Zn-finger nucleic acid-binding protein